MEPSAISYGLSYACDAVGNQVDGAGRENAYDFMNLPLRIGGDEGSQFGYAPTGQRYRHIGNGYTTSYGVRGYERSVSISTSLDRVELGTVTITTSGGVHTPVYNLRDRLGSTTALSGVAQTLTQTRSYDAFGKARNGDFSPRKVGNLGLAPETLRGFTQHEHLDDVQLIHMNGRVYDYNLGRFLSVDPIIQFPANSQSLNPYSYILNNPLSGRDPSGYEICTGSKIDTGTCDGTSGGSRVESIQVSAGASGGGDNKSNGRERQGARATASQESADKTGASDKRENAGAQILDPVKVSPDSDWVRAENVTLPIYSAEVTQYYLDVERDIANRTADRMFGLFGGLMTPYYEMVRAYQEQDSHRAAEAGGMLLTLGVSGEVRQLSQIASAGGVIRRFEQPAEQVYYRVFSDSAAGQWLTAVPPRGSAWAQEALSLPPGNAATLIQEVRVPAGTLMERSRALPVPPWSRMRGGAEQFQLLEEIPLRSFGPGVPLP